VQHLLVEASAGTAAAWIERGQRYFAVILQARYGTTDPKKKNLLRSAGLTETALQPIRIAQARKFLSREFDWVEPHYASLCDYVHHNLSSQRTAGAFAGESATAVSSTGGMLILPSPGFLIQYEFPLPEPGRLAVNNTASRTLMNVKGLVQALNQLPRSPYTEDELVARTGSRIGLNPPTRPPQ
jgi:hypothetical protein